MKAFPFLHKHPTTGETTLDQGMELRDYFAARAMVSLLHEIHTHKLDNDVDDEYYKAEKKGEDQPDAMENYIHHPNFWAMYVSTNAYAIAEAMLKARTLEYGDVINE
jgi:hypothetical protein